MKINIKDFLEKLQERGILYCSWKNNHLLDDVLNCDKDLDIYIPLRQKAEFLSILQTYNFVEGVNKLSTFPFIHHFYTPGENRKLFHLHVYFRLLTGESHLKDYWLPLENQLEQRREKTRNLLFVPDAETQRLIYVVRHYLKKSSLIGLLMHWRERKDYAEELNYLSCKELRADTPEIIQNELINNLDKSLENSNSIATYLLGLKLRIHMRSLKRISGFRAFYHRYINMILRIINKLIYHRKKTLAGGGRFIAITGLDGSGKTSIIKNICSVLEKDFTVKKIHIGRPPATLLSLPLRGALLLRKRLILTNRFFEQKSNEEETIQNRSQKKTNLIAALRFTVLAYERNMLARKAYKYACQGEIIISDRYPSITLGKMDSPRISVNKSSSYIIRWLSNIEQRYYKTMPQPDLLIELTVPVEIALKRNQERQKEGKETDDEIRDRYNDNCNLVYKASNHLKINNDQTIEVANEKILDIVWRNLF